MIKKLPFILFLMLTISISAQNTNTVTINWSFNSTPSASGLANSNRTIEVGDKVTWNWYSGGSHNVKSNSSSNESFSSAFFGTGGTFSHTFTSVGTNSYVCTPHSDNMFGTINVVAEGVLSTDNFAFLDNIGMYPNPASSKINFAMNNNEQLNVKIYNLLGKEVLNSSIDETNNSISVATLSKGMYIAKITTTDGKSFSTRKFVKE